QERGYPSVYPTYDWYGDEGQEAGQIDLQKYFRILQRHWLVIVTTLIIAIFGGLAKTLLTTPIYAAATTLQIDKEQQRVANMQTGLDTPQTGSNDEFFQTQFGLLKSRSLAEATAKDPRLGLTQDTALLKKIGIIPEKGKRPTTAQIQ
ncbi:Wzz/FepE/Etk N-terminal domain-containing protein, partial [Escherichia coli]|uniref:Wzz/FepE/Etk N-terminal domain-containing protein n=1 Tax=Escherichia coli TaxID=562 RepID=UPI00312C8908